MCSNIEKIVIEEICREFKSFAAIQLPPRNIASFKNWQLAMVATMDDVFKREVSVEDYDSFIKKLREKSKPNIAKRIEKIMREQGYKEENIQEAMEKLDDTFEKIIAFQLQQIKELEETIKKIRAKK